MNLLTVVSDRIARAFNRSGATPTVALDISKAFDRVWYAGRLHKISGQIIGLISPFFSDRRLWLQDEKSSQNIQLMLDSSSRLHSWSYTFPDIY